MKRIFCICLAFVFFGCKKDNNLIPNNILKQTQQDSIQNSNTDVGKTFKKQNNEPVNFKNRAEELIYIREYLKENLPKAILRNNPELVEKAQYELIIMGQNPTLEEAAKKTLAYSNYYNRYMSQIATTEMPFIKVKEQLESSGKLDFNEYINKEVENYNYNEENNIKHTKTKQEEINKQNITKEPSPEAMDALNSLLGKSKKNLQGDIYEDNTERRLLNKPTKLKFDCAVEGKIVMKLTINPKGDVIDAIRTSGISDTCTVNYVIKECLKIKYTPSTNPKNVTTSFVFNFTNQD